MWRQLDCDVCGAKAPLHEILIGESMNCLCQICWEDMLKRAGDE
jgi:hypothetical protein